MMSGNYKLPNPQQVGLASGIGGLGAGLANMLFPGENAYDAAAPYFNQVSDVAHQGYDPYINAGKTAMQQLQGQFGPLLSNPGARLNEIGQAFQQSPGYQFQLQQGQNAVNNAAAAGGMLGTPAHIQNSANVMQGLANQDYYNWLGHALGLYKTGLAGTEGLNNLGFQGSQGLVNALSQNLGNQGALAYGNVSDQNAAQGQMWGDIFGGLGSLAAGFLF